MRTRAGALFVVAAACLPLAAPAPAQTSKAAGAWTESRVVERLNQAAEGFKTLTARLEFTKFTAVVDDKSVESGRLYYSNNRRVLIQIEQPEPKEMLFTGDKANLYYPKMKQIQEFDLEKHRGLVAQFLLLGFGTSGDDLKDAYLITVLGEIKFEAAATLLLELTPKDARVRQHVHKIHLWLDMGHWAPVRQKFFEPGGDYLLTRYTDIKVNVPLAQKKLELSAPPQTPRLKPRAP